MCIWSSSATPCDADKLHLFDVDEITPDILDAAIASVERENDLYQVGQQTKNIDNVSQSENIDGIRTPNNGNELAQAQIDAMIESKYLKTCTYFISDSFPSEKHMFLVPREYHRK